MFVKVKSALQSNIKYIFDEELNLIVQDAEDIISDNNMLLKGLNMGD